MTILAEERRRTHAWDEVLGKLLDGLENISDVIEVRIPRDPAEYYHLGAEVMPHIEAYHPGRRFVSAGKSGLLYVPNQYLKSLVGCGDGSTQICVTDFPYREGIPPIPEHIGYTISSLEEIAREWKSIMAQRDYLKVTPSQGHRSFDSYRWRPGYTQCHFFW